MSEQPRVRAHRALPRLRRAAARARLRGRAGADDGLARGDRAARPARNRRHPPRRRARRSRRRRSASPNSTRCSHAISSARSSPELEGEPSDEEPLQAAEDSRSDPSRSSATRPDESGRQGDARRSGFRRAASRPATTGETLRRFARALPAPRCRGGAAIAGARRAAGPADRCAPHVSRRHARSAGEFLRLRRRRAAAAAAPHLLVLIDVSGSMKERTQAHLRFAHALARRRRHGRSLHHRHAAHPHHPAAAPAATANRRSPPRRSLVADWDGGTRIGDALAGLSRRAALRRAGARRGGRRALRRPRARRSDRDGATRSPASRASPGGIIWLTPLAADPALRAAHRRPRRERGRFSTTRPTAARSTASARTFSIAEPNEKAA